MKAAYCIISLNYLPFAKSLIESFLKFHPDYQFYIGLIDKLPTNELGIPTNVHILPLTTIMEESELNYLSTRYTAFELSCVLKPYYAIHIFKEYNPSLLIYLDADIVIFNKFDVVEKNMLQYQIMITPHFFKQSINGFPPEHLLFRVSIYNAGFFALTQGEQCFAFLDWWKERLRLFCYDDAQKGLYVDQAWLSYVPVYYDKSLIIRDLGYNVGYWNLHERSIKKEKECYWVNDNTPLVFYHYSGHHIEQPHILSKHSQQFNFEQRPDLIELFQIYQQNVLNADYDRYKSIQCPYGIAPKTKKKKWYKKIFNFYSL